MVRYHWSSCCCRFTQYYVYGFIMCTYPMSSAPWWRTVETIVVIFLSERISSAENKKKNNDQVEIYSQIWIIYPLYTSCHKSLVYQCPPISFWNVSRVVHHRPNVSVNPFTFFSFHGTTHWPCSGPLEGIHAETIDLVLQAKIGSRVWIPRGGASSLEFYYLTYLYLTYLFWFIQ